MCIPKFPFGLFIEESKWGFPQGLRKQKLETTCFRSGVLCETGNRNRNNLWSWSPCEAAGGQNCCNFFLRCRSASESVFAGILDQIFHGFINSKNVFSDAEVLEI